MKENYEKLETKKENKNRELRKKTNQLLPVTCIEGDEYVIEAILQLWSVSAMIGMIFQIIR